MKKIILIVMSLMYMTIVRATNYYISSGSGSDKADGLTEATAWATLAKVQSFSYVPGDHILLKCGSTWNERLTFPSNGSTEEDIVLSSYSTDNLPKIGQLVLSGKKHITISNIHMLADIDHEALSVDHCSNLTFESITADGQKIINCNRYQVAAFFYSDNINIRNSIIKNGGNHIGTDYGGGLGINHGCHDFLVEGNLVFNHAEHCMQCYSDDDKYPDYNITFRGNTVYNEDGYYNDCRGINVGWRCNNVIVERNNVSNTKTFLISTDSYTHDVIVRNNMLFYTINSGSSVFMLILANLYGYNRNTYVYNNSMFHTSHISGGAFINIATSEGAINTGHCIYNNLCVTYNPGVAFIFDTNDNNSPHSEFKSDYNLVYSMVPSGSFNNWINSSGQDSHSFYGNPLLKGIENYNESNVLGTSGSELLTNTSFLSNADGWGCYFDPAVTSGSYIRTTVAGEYFSSPAGLKVVCTKNGNHQANIQLYNSVGVKIEKNKWYILSFKAKSSIQFNVSSIYLMKMGPPYTSYASGNSGELITTDWKTYNIFFFTSQAANDGRITWYLGNSMPAAASFYMDDISFKLADGLNSTILPDITDYTTPGNSSCIDAGLVLSDVTDDYLGRPRPAGLGYDIGANEYNPCIGTIPVRLETITGNLNVCSGSSNTYYTAAFPGVYFTWQLPDGWTGTSMTNSITAKAGTTGGNITVTANNSCGSSTPQSLSVTTNAKPETPVITMNNGILQSNTANDNQWYLNPKIIKNATDPTYVPSLKGYYYVVVTVNGCPSEPSNHISFDPVGIDEPADNEGIRVYPNPTTGVVMITLTNSFNSDYMVDIYNNLGVLLQKLKKNKLEVYFDLDLNKNSTGVYLIRIYNSDKYFQFKEIKK